MSATLLDHTTTIDEGMSNPGEATTEDEFDLGAATEGLRDMMESVDLERITESAAGWVRDHPLVALGGAVAVGFILGAMVRPGPRERESGGSVLRQAAADFGRELQSQAVDYRQSAAHKIAEVASTVIGKEQGDGVRSQATGLLTDTVRTAVTALALNKLSEWLRRSA